MKTILTLGDDFIRKHQWLLEMTKSCGVAICGGCAAAICKDDTDYSPPDLDLVTTQEGAIQLISMINRFLMSKSTHYRIYVNTNNEYVPTPASAHFRVTCAFWVPVCIFVLPPELFRFYRIGEGYMLQLPSDIKNAAKDLTGKDGKARIANDDRDWWDESENEDDLEISEETKIAVSELPEKYTDLHRAAYSEASDKHLSNQTP